jgi:hypothetical protein
MGRDGGSTVEAHFSAVEARWNGGGSGGSMAVEGRWKGGVSADHHGVTLSTELRRAELTEMDADAVRPAGDIALR